MKGQKKSLVRRSPAQWILFVILLALCLFMISPIVWLFSAALQDNASIYMRDFAWIPKVFNWQNFKTAWVDAKMNTAFGSTAAVSVIMLVFHLFFCTLAGYVLGKFDFKYKPLVVGLIMATMMLPQEVTYFPVYTIMRKLGLLNTYFGMAMPFFISGVGVFFMIQFSQYVPTEIIEAARMDGCSEWGIFFKIALPNMKSSISALAIMAFSFIWNEYAWANLCSSSDRTRTLSITLAMLANDTTNEIQTVVMLAGGVITVLPIILLFICFSKNFIESVTRSGLKG